MNAGNIPQHHEGRKSRQYEPPRRYSNESSERYQERMRGRRGQGLISRLEDAKADLKRRRAKDTTSDGELRGVKFEPPPKESRLKSKQQRDLADRRRTDAEERELSRIRRRRRARRGR